MRVLCVELAPLRFTQRRRLPIYWRGASVRRPFNGGERCLAKTPALNRARLGSCVTVAVSPSRNIGERDRLRSITKPTLARKTAAATTHRLL